MTLPEFLLTQHKQPEVHMPAKPLIEDRYLAYLYSGCKVLYVPGLDDVVLLLYCSPAVSGVKQVASVWRRRVEERRCVCRYLRLQSKSKSQ